MARYVIIGAGAVGGVIGASLFGSDHEVVLVARGAQYEAIRANGLELETPDGTDVWHLPVVESVADAKLVDGDAVLLAVKSQDTPSVIGSLVASAPLDIKIVCLQNGVENERLALRHFESVYGALVVVSSTYLSPGTVSVASSPVIGLCDVGCYPAGTDQFCIAFAEDLNASKWSSNAVGDIERWKYTKLLGNLSNAAQIVLGLELRDSVVAELVLAEGVECLDAAGIAYVSLEEMQQRRTIGMSGSVSRSRTTGASTWQSIARGAGSIETDYLNGEIVLLGRLHGVATPVNRLLQTTAAEVVAGRREPASMTEDEFLETAGA